MKHLLLAACLGVFTLSAGSVAIAQETAKASTAKKSAAKPKAKASSKKRTTKAAATAAAPVVPEGEKWQCELGKSLYVAGNMLRDEVITVHWDGRNHRLPRQATVTGADRYFDPQSGLDLVVIPSKAMLFDRNHGQRLADECQTTAMLAGAAAPTQSGALRAPVTKPLLVAPSDQPAQSAEPAAPAAAAAPAAGSTEQQAAPRQ
ncbi:hypothetical protein EM868_09650 [Cupriavidus gilardii]|uniref:hypothetical protein n=1 Tax=Cupriavidus gilardii TaxID=82541 RepID=UPI001EE577C4|nr:hypothetical protein [Cupriavidus gilardii]MCG5262603.1 hypothetical protein [Cupriavidus gilardii]MDF9430062.1 hypothetical protein [Cupriavidus gilardii]